jgi:hypothetical protein
VSILDDIDAWVRLPPRRPHCVYLSPKFYGKYLVDRVWRGIMCDPHYYDGVRVVMAQDDIDPPLQMRHRRDPLLFGASA